MTRKEAKELLMNISAYDIDMQRGMAKQEAIEMAISALEQQKTGWIPVSERLPKDHENVLIYLSSNQITIGLYNSHRLPFMDKPIGWGADSSHDWSSDDVAAWMPLPEPYKGVEE